MKVCWGSIAEQQHIQIFNDQVCSCMNKYQINKNECIIEYVASLSLFYRYYFGHCSDELAACIPPPMARPRSTRQATFAHNYCVELSNARINRFSDGFFPSTSHL